MRITYTNQTSRCPYCGSVLHRKTDAWRYLLVFIFPFALAYWISDLIISRIAKPTPLPTELMGGTAIGKEFEQCPKCGNIVRTGKTPEEKLTPAQRYTWQYRNWFRLANVLGVFAFVALFGFLISLNNINNIGGPQILGLLLNLLPALGGIAAILVIYRKGRRACESGGNGR